MKTRRAFVLTDNGIQFVDLHQLVEEPDAYSGVGLLTSLGGDVVPLI